MSVPKTNTIITIGRQFGSAGLAIGQIVAKELGLELYDKRRLEEITAEHENITETLKKTNDKVTNSFLYSLVMDTETGAYIDLPLNHKRFLTQIETIQKIAKKGPCVFVGRCADYALAGDDNVISFYIHASIPARIRRIARLYDVTDAKAQDMIQDRDIKRHNYYNFYSSKKWGEAESYNICLDSSVLGIEGTAAVIKKLVSMKEKNTYTKL